MEWVVKVGGVKGQKKRSELALYAQDCCQARWTYPQEMHSQRHFVHHFAVCLRRSKLVHLRHSVACTCITASALFIVDVSGFYVILILICH